MSFEDVLGRRLGPMRELVRRKKSEPAPSFDPAGLSYRRALGLEATFRPRESWSRVAVSTPEGKTHELGLEEGLLLFALSSWKTAEEIGLSPQRVWSWVERGLVYFSEARPDVELTGRSGWLRAEGPIARRRSVLVTPAVETAVEIAPMSFMPRGRDLLGATVVGARFASRERGEEVFALNVIGDQALGTRLFQLITQLDGQKAGHVLAEVDDRDSHKLLRLLDACGFLEAEPPSLERLRSSLAHPSSPQLTWLGHAGVLVQSQKTNVLVDPVFFSESDPPEPHRSTTPFDERALPKIDGVLLTHGDNDHANPSSLALLPRDTPIFIPKGADPYPPFQVDLRGILNVLGFRQIHELETWQTVRIGPFEVTACPFEGEDWGLELAQSTYLLESPELSVFFSADSFRMPETYQWLAERPRAVDVAFLGISGSAESHAAPAAFGYGNFYRDYISLTLHQQWVQHCAGPIEAAENAALFQPKTAFGYACGGASFIKTAHSDRGDAASFTEALGRLAPSVRPLQLALGVPSSIDASDDRGPPRLDPASRSR